MWIWALWIPIAAIIGGITLAIVKSISGPGSRTRGSRTDRDNREGPRCSHRKPNPRGFEQAMSAIDLTERRNRLRRPLRTMVFPTRRATSAARRHHADRDRVRPHAHARLCSRKPEQSDSASADSSWPLGSRFSSTVVFERREPSLSPVLASLQLAALSVASVPGGSRLNTQIPD